MNKKFRYTIIVLLVIVLFSSGCVDDPGKIQKDAEPKFLLLNYNENNKLEAGAFISLLEIKKGEPEITPLDEIYPMGSLSSNVDIRNNRVVMGLHSNFNTDGKSRRSVGIWFDVLSTTWEELPLLPSGNTNRYSYFDVATGKVSESGYVYYLSSSNDISYNDQYLASLVRYNPNTDELEQAEPPAFFVLEQPEKGGDTETGQFKRDFYPSDNGRYVYGVVEAFGVSGGSYHWDYEILFKYDFQLDKYTRLGDSSDKHVTLIGMNSSRTELLYYSKIGSDYQRKIVNTETNVVNEVTISGGQGLTNTSRWNSNGYCPGETNNTIGVYDLMNNSKHDIRTPSRPYSAQFSPNGGNIYFMMMSATNNYLCKTSDISATATIDTICALSSTVNEFMIVK